MSSGGSFTASGQGPFTSASPFTSGQGPYPSALLNELHTHFPAVLYDSSRFTTVPDLLDYIQSQMRSRFDLFSNNRREYQETHTPVRNNRRRLSPPPLPNRSHQNNEWRSPSRNSTQSVEPQQQQAPLGTDPNTYPLRAAPPLQEEESDDVLAEVSNILLSTLGQLFPSLRTSGTTHLYTVNLPSTFQDPVPITPTQEQLLTSTTVSVLGSSLADNCAVCQDSMSQGATVRKINHCGHTFHRTCVDTWFLTNVRCPTCRHDIRTLSAANTR